MTVPLEVTALDIQRSRRPAVARGKRPGDRLTVPQALAAMRRTLSAPGQAVRLVGLSGTGKTRLVQALVEAARVASRCQAIWPCMAAWARAQLRWISGRMTHWTHPEQRFE
ncbi:hypothetical protein [Pelomonas sp. Root1444]|uniref:hypothetical protein n=1 Tax=Pelomonas sp. Root1444 TaxID=1736464 RepID=UPI001F2708C1|nr:hypothetical protein [Pelomonas sp. Root1444]